MQKHKNNLMRDLGIVALSILIALLLVKTGFLRNLLVSTKGFEFLEIFVGGFFFTSVFTTAPAIVFLGELAQENSIFLVAFLGAIGSFCGDLIIFRFIKEDLSEDMIYLISHSKLKRLKVVFHLKIFRWVIPLLGALIIASPLPDELGIMMMGFSKMKLSRFIPISLLMNFLGILAVGLVARSL